MASNNNVILPNGMDASQKLCMAYRPKTEGVTEEHTSKSMTSSQNSIGAFPNFSMAYRPKTDNTSAKHVQRNVNIPTPPSSADESSENVNFASQRIPHVSPQGYVDLDSAIQQLLYASDSSNSSNSMVKVLLDDGTQYYVSQQMLSDALVKLAMSLELSYDPWVTQSQELVLRGLERRDFEALVPFLYRGVDNLPPPFTQEEEVQEDSGGDDSDLRSECSLEDRLRASLAKWKEMAENGS